MKLYQLSPPFKSKKLIFLVLALLLWGSNFAVFAQVTLKDSLLFGAEVYIEPTQTPEEIDGYFKTLQEQGFSLTRIRITENYCKNKAGDWDFTLFDYAFKAAEKYHIKVYGNLFPLVDEKEIGGLKFPQTQENLKSIETYIQKTVFHFKQFKSLYGWVPINEPGSGRVPKNSFAEAKFESWLNNQQQLLQNNLPNYVDSPFKEEAFLKDYNTWYLTWLVSEIKKWDNQHPIHVNNHAIFQLAAEYDFPAWRAQISSLGGSAHASWHFSYFDRQHYTTAISANSEILRAGAGPLPWLMTELQGGTNVFSGSAPLSPTVKEINQWLWTVISTGSKGALFWSLNSRKAGLEAGEWAMLNYQNQPSERLLSSGKIAKLISNNQSLFSNASVMESGVNLLYVRESMWTDKRFASSNDKDFEARKAGAGIKSALAFFQAFADLGIQCNFKEIAEFDFSKSDFSNTTIVLANQIALPQSYNQKLENFVAKGGTLIVEGLSAYFNQNEQFNLGKNFPLSSLFGGSVSEFQIVADKFSVSLASAAMPKLAAHYIIGNIIPKTSKPIAYFGKKVIGTENIYGKGRVVWLPTLLGLGAQITNNYQPLANFLASLNLSSSFQFKNYQSNVYTKTLQAENANTTTLINKSNSIKTVEFNRNMQNIRIIFNDDEGFIKQQKIKIYPNQTMVFTWN